MVSRDSVKICTGWKMSLHHTLSLSAILTNNSISQSNRYQIIRFWSHAWAWILNKNTATDISRLPICSKGSFIHFEPFIWHWVLKIKSFFSQFIWLELWAVASPGCPYKGCCDTRINPRAPIICNQLRGPGPGHRHQSPKHTF